jgi:hypothetical protein
LKDCIVIELKVEAQSASQLCEFMADGTFSARADASRCQPVRVGRLGPYQKSYWAWHGS